MNSEPNDEVCDARDDDSSIDDDNIKIFINIIGDDIKFKDSRWAVRTKMD